MKIFGVNLVLCLVAVGITGCVGIQHKPVAEGVSVPSALEPTGHESKRQGASRGSTQDTASITPASSTTPPHVSISPPHADDTFVIQASASMPIVQPAVEHESNATELAELETLVRQNPMLQQINQQYHAARAKARYVDDLPDPTIGTNVFGHPIETAAGSQRANLSISQMLPWLPRLNAQEQQACLEAASLGQMYAQERLRILASVRAEWYRLYALQKQLDVHVANQELLKTIIDVANARVSTGQASQGDVLAGTTEYSKLEEQILTLRQRIDASQANLNQLVARPADTRVTMPDQIDAELPAWEHAMLRDLAWANQPEIEVARIRQQAACWGIEVARLQRRPNVTMSASWFFIDDNRPTPSMVQVGEDAWSLGAMMTVPLSHGKFDAMEQESRWKHAAAASSVEELKLKYDAVLRELWATANAAAERAKLYEQTILPDARRTLAADQAAYTNGNVEFDRVIQDFRTLTMLELGYHQARAELATAIAQIRRAVGIELALDEKPSDSTGPSS